VLAIISADHYTLDIIMKPNTLKNWRDTGDYAAFAPVLWEFYSQLYFSAARQLRNDFKSYDVKASPFEAIACLVVAQFNMCLAVELICKARYLKVTNGPREKVYTHQVSKLLPAGLLSKEQKELLNFAAQNVEWAGRYPTPKWDLESNKEKYDIPEYSNSNSFETPNRATIELIDALEALYGHIHQAWIA
jgi:hypothetical protein